MALIVEDGSVVAGAETYVSVTDTDDYWSRHGRLSDTSWIAAATADREAAIRQAATYLDHAFRWKGARVSISQALAWPRSAVVDKEGEEQSSQTIPQAMIDAICILAKEALSDGLVSTFTKDNAIKRKAVSVAGAISETTEYQNWAPRQKHFPEIELLINGLHDGPVNNDRNDLVRA